MSALVAKKSWTPRKSPFLFSTFASLFVLVEYFISTTSPGHISWMALFVIGLGIGLMLFRRINLIEAALMVGCCIVVSFIFSFLIILSTLMLSDSGIAPAFFGVCSFFGAFFAFLFAWMVTCLFLKKK